MDLYILIAGIIILLAILSLLIVFKLRKRSLRGSSLKKVQQAWEHVETIHDPNLQVLEGDKVVDLALGLLGYQGSMGDKLNKAGPRFSDVNALWNAHKLRNRLAHEIKTQISRGECERAMSAFRRALKDLGM